MRDIIEKHLAECEAWRKTCEERFDEALAQGCVPTLNNYSWVSWDKSPDPYGAWNMGAEFARIMVKRQIEQQQAQLEAWEELVDTYLTCDVEFLEAGIKRIKAMGE
ncbi:MAG: hypothetical protein GY753_02440 [Gammaproteobacteria bacterium]|nr:hypothetical protein [Gammaproteobacteria bacterium]